MHMTRNQWLRCARSHARHVQRPVLFTCEPENPGDPDVVVPGRPWPELEAMIARAEAMTDADWDQHKDEFDADRW